MISISQLRILWRFDCKNIFRYFQSSLIHMEDNMDHATLVSPGFDHMSLLLLTSPTASSVLSNNFEYTQTCIMQTVCLS